MRKNKLTIKQEVKEMLVTKELKKHFIPDYSNVHNANKLPTPYKDTMQWGNSDEEFIIKFNMKTDQMTGCRYQWSEEEQDWVDGETMKDTELLDLLVNGELLIPGYRI